MAKIGRSRRRICSRQLRSAPYPPAMSWVTGEAGKLKGGALALERKDWEEATCSVCMESPHNAVLLLCSSHEKGCRAYMCGTGYRLSNCLDQFKKAAAGKPAEALKLACPLCRGQVKGWTVVEPARKFLNSKPRTCMEDACSYTGTYSELKRHVRSEHPCANPREVDPHLEEKWRSLERERERQDVISTITSSMPRSVVFGDYVIEMPDSDPDTDDDDEADRRGLSTSILYFFLREGARLMRFQRDLDAREAIQDDAPAADISPSSATSVSDILGSDRPRRRRRRRTRGSSQL